MDRKTLLTTLLIGGGTDAGTAIAQLQHAVSVLDETKADKTGTVALANNLTPYSADSGVTQAIPFINQGTGCGNGEAQVDTGSYAQIKNKLGNTVCVNQQISEYTRGSGTIAGVAYTRSADHKSITLNGTATETDFFQLCSNEITIIAGHKYILDAPIQGSPTTIAFYLFKQNIRDYGSNVIAEAEANSSNAVGIWINNGCVFNNLTIELPAVSDLSLWYGSTDRIPSHLLSHPEDWGKYYSGSLAYNPGQLVNADGSVLTSIGRNVWNERTRNGYYTNAGVFSANANYVANETPIPVIPNTEYYEAIVSTLPAGRDIFFYDGEGNFIRKSSLYSNASFTTPSNCAYINFNFGSAYGATYKNDFTISLYYPNESGYDQHYPYTVLADVDTGSEVLRSSFSVCDSKAPDGTITRRVDHYEIAAGDTWSYSGSAETGFWYLSGKFPNSAVSTLVMNPRGLSMVIGNTSGQIRVYPQYNPDIITNETDMSTVFPVGSVFHCARTTPTTEAGTPFSGASADNFTIDDFGSMYWEQTNGVPQGVEIFYPYDYKAAVDTLLNMVSGDVEELVTETELGAVADRIPEAPAEDGTYTLKATVADGVKTYAWVADA